MLRTNRKTLAIIGAGPKGLAVAVKAKVMEEFGVPGDRVVLIERHSVGANWSGEAGFTNGEMRLGTSPEKDLVFPLETVVGDKDITQKIRQRLMEFTWTSYLVEKQKFSDWVDRGRPAPTHREWANYLQWVAGQLAPEVTVIKAQVESIGLSSDLSRWSLSLGDNHLEAHRLMLTGPGKARLEFKNATNAQGVYDLESFWKKLKDGSFEKKGKLAIVGAGENAASVLLALSKFSHELEISIISPKGFISTRAENYHENQFYSRPEKKGWKKLCLKDRKDFIKRTDLGVFSVEAMKTLNNEENHEIVPGRVINLEEMNEGLGLALTLQYGSEQTVKTFDQVVLATGFDSLATLKSLLTKDALAHLALLLGAPLTNEGLALEIQEDLSVKGVLPALHLPMLAGLSEGPGFANLSCLGLLSDRIMLTHQSVEQKLFVQSWMEA